MKYLLQDKHGFLDIYHIVNISIYAYISGIFKVLYTDYEFAVIYTCYNVQEDGACELSAVQVGKSKTSVQSVVKYCWNTHMTRVTNIAN